MSSQKLAVLSKSDGAARTITLFSPYWFMNRTHLDLFYKDSSDRDQEILPHESSYDKPFLFSFKKLASSSEKVGNVYRLRSREHVWGYRLRSREHVWSYRLRSREHVWGYRLRSKHVWSYRLRSRENVWGYRLRSRENVWAYCENLSRLILQLLSSSRLGLFSIYF